MKKYHLEMSSSDISGRNSYQSCCLVRGLEVYFGMLLQGFHKRRQENIKVMHWNCCRRNENKFLVKKQIICWLKFLILLIGFCVWLVFFSPYGCSCSILNTYYFQNILRRLFPLSTSRNSFSRRKKAQKIIQNWKQISPSFVMET